MEAIIERCGGLDVHKKEIVSCVIVGEANKKPQKEVRRFSTMTSGLEEMKAWLKENGCTHVAMESTGVYWKPVFNILEDDFVVLLANARHIKNVPGRKTDVKDCEWIAELLRHGLIAGSFIPPREIRDLRDLTRYRRKLVQMSSSEQNRIQKVLEDANIKLSSVLSDLFGVSGQDMLEAIVNGERTPEKIANFAKGRLKTKIPEIREALNGNVSDHHRFLIGEMLGHISEIEERIKKLDERIMKCLKPFQEELDILKTTGMIKDTTGASIIAEIGTKMEQFPSSQHISSWAGVCPGNNESAGKKKSTKTTPGNKWLQATLTEVAWAASKKKGSFLKSKYHRIAARRGKKRAIVAISHNILKICYYLLKLKVTYQELGEHYFDEINKESRKRYYLNRLKNLGYDVQLTDIIDVSMEDAQMAA